MKLEVIRRIDKADISRSGEVPKWIDALLNPLNAFLEGVVTALRGRLTFEDNFLCRVGAYSFVAGTELEVNPTVAGNARLRVTGVIPVSSSSGQIATFGWTQKTNGNIGITVTLAGATESTIRIIILLG